MARILYHLTWDCHIPEILEKGLVPNRHPNKWLLEAAKTRSVGKTFLCKKTRMPQWQDVYEGDWAGYPGNNAQLVWLRINVSGLELTPDQAENSKDDYTGDFYTTQIIDPARIKVL